MWNMVAQFLTFFFSSKELKVPEKCQENRSEFGDDWSKTSHSTAFVNSQAEERMIRSFDWTLGLLVFIAFTVLVRSDSN